MQEMRIEGIGVKFPTLRLEPALQLPYGGLDGTLTRVTAGGDARLQHHEVAALEVAGGDQTVNWDAGVEVELQAGRILAAPIGLLQLHDHRAPGSHDTAVAREYLIGERRVGREKMHLDPCLPVGIDHLVVLPPRNPEYELQSHPSPPPAYGP